MRVLVYLLLLAALAGRVRWLPRRWDAALAAAVGAAYWAFCAPRPEPPGD